MKGVIGFIFLNELLKFLLQISYGIYIILTVVQLLIQLIHKIKGSGRRKEMISLDLRSRKPIYEQLVEKLKELIIHEVFKADEKLPSVRFLSKELTVNPNTIQKAYRELEHQGYIYSIPGKGSFVVPQAITTNNEKVEKVKSDLVKILSEALYLGLDKEEIVRLIEEAEKTVKGGEIRD
mgnify:CR=1 FL=1